MENARDPYVGIVNLLRFVRKLYSDSMHSSSEGDFHSAVDATKMPMPATYLGYHQRKFQDDKPRRKSGNNTTSAARCRVIAELLAYF